MTSQIKTVLLLGLLTAIILFFGSALGGQTGLVIAFGIALVMNVGSYWYSDKLVLKMYKAQEIPREKSQGLHAMVEELSREAGIPKPRVYYIPEETPNAFATGRNPEHGVVAVTDGILKVLNEQELKGVLAHEIGHIKNRDILIQSVAATLSAVIMFVASMVKWGAILGMGRDDDEGGNPLIALVMAFVAPIAAMLIQMAISRTREYKADASGAQFAHRPEYLASALEKLHAYSQRVPLHHGNPSTAHMFIVNPFSALSIGKLFSTHPPIEERVRRLRQMQPSR